MILLRLFMQFIYCYITAVGAESGSQSRKKKGGEEGKEKSSDVSSPLEPKWVAGANSPSPQQPQSRTRKTTPDTGRRGQAARDGEGEDGLSGEVLNVRVCVWKQWS